jgi:RHH-type transcriptional regulator, proline utilization regulon repressor / proline dehydrogenase / delta 1-pyrroline-5-carboxylate dehydrogenase
VNAEDPVEAASRLAAELLEEAGRIRSPQERRQAARLARIMGDPVARRGVLALTDEMLRIRQPPRAAAIFAGIADGVGSSSGFGLADRLALRGGRVLAPVLPGAVVPLVRARVRSEMSGVILPASPRRLARHAARRRGRGIRLNLNVLGEAVLGDAEATRRLGKVLEVIERPYVDYVSVKISSICAQIDVLAFEAEIERIAQPLRALYDAAGRFRPPKFVNLDMEEYRDLALTAAVFRKVLDEDRYSGIDAGIVLQAYLPDSLAVLEDLCAWARTRFVRHGGAIKVRLVKGANLAMETVEAELHGWPPAPFATKRETDAQYKRMLKIALDPANAGAVRVGVASHNLFEVAWAAQYAEAAGAIERVDFEMLEGMSPATAEAVAARLGRMLLYAPIVEPAEIESAIAYLVRRLDENSGPENFITHQYGMTVGSPAWVAEEARFRASVADLHLETPPTRRMQDRRTEEETTGPRDEEAVFRNEPDTDFTVAANREWAVGHLRKAARSGLGEYLPVINGSPVEGGDPQPGVDPSRPDVAAYRWTSARPEMVEKALTAAECGQEWSDTTVGQRRRVLLRAASVLAQRRGRLLAVMAVETGKTLREGDPEVSEAVDFASYYARHIPAADSGFRPYGTVVVASPWNFPLSIPAGGVLAALAAGNSVILKPAPEAVAVAGELARALWDAGVPPSALQFVPCVDGDASRLLITDPRVDAVILTGAWETARTFLRWRPSLRLHAETSGKNSIVVTATADPDQAIADIVHSAFGHAGQKCSAASLAILEAPVHDDGRFLRRLADAVASLKVGPAADPRTVVGPLIRPPRGPLDDALRRLGPGERWLVEPKQLDQNGYLWRPGVKSGVASGSPFHLTECFGPVLGIMGAADLEEAIGWQNTPEYGLTAGLQALDPAEVVYWRERVDAGNLYVNRGITGAIVGRQPFGGWKHSVVGPGAKAGGRNYVSSLGRWPSGGATGSPEAVWAEMRQATDEIGLLAEANSFLYRPIPTAALYAGPGVTGVEVETAAAAAAAVGTHLRRVSRPEDGTRADKLRLLGEISDDQRLAAIDAGVWFDDTPVASDPQREVLRWVREQSVSESRHRHGSITSRRPGLVDEQ